MTNMSQFDEKMFFSSPLSNSSIIYSEMAPQALENTKKRATRRRRKKEKSEDIGSEWKKRRLTDEQVKFLEMNFGEERKLESGRKVSLANEVGLDPKQVAVWFQNRRARWKTKQLEDEYTKVKSQHDATVVDKCHLENENLKLKQLLSEAEEEIKRLSLQNEGLVGSGGGGGGGGGGGSPSSSSTNTFQPCLGEFGMEEDHLMYANEYTFANYIMDWGYLL